MSEYIHKSHNVTVLMYHLVFPAKYRRAVIDEAVDEELKDVCFINWFCFNRLHQIPRFHVVKVELSEIACCGNVERFRC